MATYNNMMVKPGTTITPTKPKALAPKAMPNNPTAPGGPPTMGFDMGMGNFLKGQEATAAKQLQPNQLQTMLRPPTSASPLQPANMQPMTTPSAPPTMGPFNQGLNSQTSSNSSVGKFAPATSAAGVPGRWAGEPGKAQTPGNMPATPAKDTFQSVAQKQGDINQQAAYDQWLLSNPNQQGPNGNVTWTGEPGERATVTTTLSPEQQQMQDQSSRLMNEGLMATQMGQELDMSGVPQAPSSDMSGLPNAPDLNNTLTRDKLAQSLIDRDQPFMDRDRSRRETQLANQGIMQGSSAYGSAQDDLSRSENDFRLGAYARAGDEQAREYGLQADARGRGLEEQSQQYGQQSNARQQAISELLTKRQLPLNELNSLRTGAQINAPQPQTFGGYNYNPADMYGAYADEKGLNLSNKNANQASNDNFMNGLFGLGGSALMFMSDRRLKENIVYHNTLPSGLNLYVANYIGDQTPYIMVMADEVEKVFPHAVLTREDGYKMVNYSMIH